MSRRQPTHLFPRRAAAPAPAAAGHRPLFLAVALATAFAAAPVRAQPSGMQAVVGGATLKQQGSTLQVTTQNGAAGFSALNWQSFSIPKGTTTQFLQPSAASTSINRVTGPDPSLIYGTLSSNGRLVLVNPNGITVGAGAVVDTAAFTASTLRMTDADMLAGRMRFADPLGGLLKVDGEVLARSGDVVLIGQRVETGAQALVHSPQGATVLAAGQKVEVTGRGLEGIVFEVQAPTDQAVNLGTLRGDAVGVFAGTLRHSGLVQAQAVSTEGGRVVLKAAAQASVAGGGVQAQALAGKGGSVDVLGTTVALTDAASIDASGANGGGVVRIGGDYQGRNAAVPNAQETVVSADSQVRANATTNGNGGRVIVWADDTTRAHGRIEARAGAQGGDGGFIETSGGRFLDVNGIQVRADAPAGQAGTWLLDPADVTIVHDGPGTQGSAGGQTTFGPGGGASTIYDSTLNQALNAGSGTNVVVHTSSTLASGAGDITFDGSAGMVQIARTAVGSATLTLQADHDIVFRGGQTQFQALDPSAPSPASGRTLNVDLVAGNAVRTAGDGHVSLSTDSNFHHVEMTLKNGKTWTNEGTLTLNLNGRLNLRDASGSGTFANAATGTVDGSAGPDGGIASKVGGAYGNFVNAGTVAITQGSFLVDTLSQSGGSLSVESAFFANAMQATGGSMSITQTVGDLAIPAGSSLALTGPSAFTSTAGNLTVDGAISAPELLLQAGGSVGQAGGSVATPKLTLFAGNQASLTRSANAIEHLVATAASLDLENTSDQLTVDGLDVSGNAVIRQHAPATAPVPPLPMAAGSVIVSADAGSVTVGGLSITADGDIRSDVALQTNGRYGNGLGDVSLKAGGSLAFGVIDTAATGDWAGGHVDLRGTSVSGGSVDTRGGSAPHAPGRDGGRVVIESTAGGVSLDWIDTSGGATTLAGGSGGAVTLTAAGGGIAVNGGISTAGGTVSSGFVGGGGMGGNVTAIASGDIAIGDGEVAILAQGGGGSGAGRGGAVTIASSGGDVRVSGVIQTFSGDLSTTSLPTLGAAGGAVDIHAAGNVSLGDVLAWGASGLYGSGSGGNVTVTADHGDLDAGVIDARGGLATLGGAGGNLTLAASGGNVTVGNLLAFGGQGATTGSAGGNVWVQATGGSASVGQIQTFGASGDDAGGNAGSVTVVATGGSVTVQAIDAQGGWIGSGPGKAGDGGNVTLSGETGVSATDIGTYGGSYDTQQTASGRAGGSGGSITLAASGGSVVAQNLNAQAGLSSSYAMAAAAGTVGIDAGGMVVVQSIRTDGGTGMGGTDGGNITVHAGGDIYLHSSDPRAPAISANGGLGMGGGSLGSGGAGAVITLVSTNGNVGVAEAHAVGGPGLTGGGNGGTFRAEAAKGTVWVDYLDASGGEAYSEAGVGGNGGNVTIAAGQGAGIGEIFAEGGFGGFSSTLGSAGGHGGNVSITVSLGDLDLYDTLISVRGGTGGYSQQVGGTGGQGGSITLTATAGSVFTNAEGPEQYGTELSADGGTGGASVGTTTTSADHGGTGGNAGTITINSGAIATLLGSMSAAGGDGGSASSAATAQARGGAGGSGNAITVNMTDSTQPLVLGGRIRASAGAGGLADFTTSSPGLLAVTADPARTGAAGSGVGTFKAHAAAGVYIPPADAAPTTGAAINLHDTPVSLAIDADWTNTGSLVLIDGAWVVAARPLTNNGSLQLGEGSVLAIGSVASDGEGMPVLVPGTGTLTNGSTGVIGGFGTVDGHVVNAGTLAPGSGHQFGTLTVTGNYQQTATGRLAIDALAQGPYEPGIDNDLLRVLGAVTLGGQLAVNELVLPVAQVAQAVSGPTAVQLAAAPVDGIVLLEAAGGITQGSTFASISSPATLRNSLMVRNVSTLQTLDGQPTTPPSPTPPAPSPTPSPPAPAPTPAASPSPAPAPTSDAVLVDAAVELTGGKATREEVREALTEQQSSVTKFSSQTPGKDDKKDEKKDTEIITTSTSCKPS